MVLSDGEKWIATQNIARWEAQLQEKDDKQRHVLRELIRLEREKLGFKDINPG